MSKKPLPCPLCSTASSVTRLTQRGGAPIWNIACGVKDDGSDSCGLVLYGGSKDSLKTMVRKWNCRKLLAIDAEEGRDE